MELVNSAHTTPVSKACKVVESGFAQCHPLWVSCPVPCEVLFLFRRNIRKIQNVKCPVLVIHPSEANTYADIEAVYQCLQTEYGVSQEDLILYGQSVGSGPTLHLSAKLPRLRGVVLHSAILAGLRVLCHM